MKNQSVKKDSGNVNSDSGQLNTDSGSEAKSWYFLPEYAFTQNQNQRSRSARIRSRQVVEAIVCGGHRFS